MLPTTHLYSFCLLLLASFPFSSAQCLVTEKKSGEQKACVFPFTLTSENGNQFQFTNCTTTIDEEGRPWCSTKTDENGLHLKGHWGYCDKGQGNCPAASTVFDQIDRVLKAVESSKGRNCPCTAFKSCPWVPGLLKLLSTLPLNNRIRIRAVTTLQSLVCSRNEKMIDCCDLNLELGGNVQENTNQIVDRSSGRWKPSDSLGECGKRLTLENIFGGTDAKLGEFPYMALLGYVVQGRTYYLCGASVLNAKYVLTAAHCHSTERPINEVVVGEHTLSTPRDCKSGSSFCLPLPQTLGIDKVIQHERWDPEEFREGYDIALVRVNPKIRLFVSSFFADSISNAINNVSEEKCNTFGNLWEDRDDLSSIELEIRKQCASKCSFLDHNVQPLEYFYRFWVNEAQTLGLDEKSFVSPICLPWNSNDPGRKLKPGVSLTVTGWGKVTNDADITRESYLNFSVASDKLQKVSLPYVDHEECSRSYTSVSRELQMCAGNRKEEDSCSGDSGGPLVYRSAPGDAWYQVGIVSFGPKQCGIGRPGVYTRLDHFLDWLENNLEE